MIKSGLDYKKLYGLNKTPSVFRHKDSALNSLRNRKVDLVAFMSVVPGIYLVVPKIDAPAMLSKGCRLLGLNYL